MYDRLAPRNVMLGDDAKQTLDDDQLYLTSVVEGPVLEIQFQIGPSQSDASEGVIVTVEDLSSALADFGLRVTQMREVS